MEWSWSSGWSLSVGTIWEANVFFSVDHQDHIPIHNQLDYHNDHHDDHYYHQPDDVMTIREPADMGFYPAFLELPTTRWLMINHHWSSSVFLMFCNYHKVINCNWSLSVSRCKIFKWSNCRRGIHVGNLTYNSGEEVNPIIIMIMIINPLNIIMIMIMFMIIIIFMMILIMIIIIMMARLSGTYWRTSWLWFWS